MLSKEDAHTLRTARRMHDRLRQIRLHRIALADSLALHSPGMNGMKATGTGSDRIADYMARMDDAQRLEEAATGRLERAVRKARPACRHIGSLGMRLFCEAYYVDARTMEEAQRIAGVCRKTAQAYRSMVEEM